MSLPEIRCGHCGRKLAEGHVLVLSIKCPRCRAHNHLKAAEPPASASSHATAKEAHAWPTPHHR
ncbi:MULTISPECIES: Com family DNA-binding transcriptional regulator [unclassified Aquitalea]|uniref:Com family DNA-binding transcriptional regulator n=1 Tax=Aquitalea TaxID=407217 RepID=UPI00103BAE96|nr:MULTISPECIES: Com family DNA-binding transcriptional regulator [unclassified Aquitalea]QBJ80005.1 Com family DNA-binding transcriptional regulator [Aquitalea sp. USM4]